MRYQNVCLESLGYTLPGHVVSSDDLEARLAPAYQRLRLPEGRLELMTGIRQRRFYDPGVQLGSMSALSGQHALEVADFDRSQIGALVHGSVCRDYLEPATACGVHHELRLPSACQVYDVSNACLGILNGVTQVANQIELGQIRAGLVVGTECGRTLVDNTVDRLNRDLSLTRQNIKLLVASLTIGSGSVAALLCHREISRTQNRLLGGTALADTDHHQLCQSDGLNTFMQTDSEQLMQQGVAAGAENFTRFLSELDGSHDDVDKTACHQVGAAHRRLLFERLELDQRKDFSTLEVLGNTGAAALPLTLALGAEARHYCPDDRIAMLGIGSGVNCLMLGVAWQKTAVAGNSREVGFEAATASSEAIA